MNTRKTAMALLGSLTLLLTLTSRPSQVVGEEPERVWRAFFLRGNPGDTFEDLPDFEAEGSQLLVTHPPLGDPSAEQTGYVLFLAPDTDEFSYVEAFFDTQWYRFRDATHATADGPQTYRLYWKDELPPTGAVARTGPEGDVMVEYGWQRSAFSNVDGIPDWSWVVVSERDPLFYNSYVPIVYGAGWFSR